MAGSSPAMTKKGKNNAHWFKCAKRASRAPLPEIRSANFDARPLSRARPSKGVLKFLLHRVSYACGRARSRNEAITFL